MNISQNSSGLFSGSVDLCGSDPVRSSTGKRRTLSLSAASQFPDLTRLLPGRRSFRLRLRGAGPHCGANACDAARNVVSGNGHSGASIGNSNGFSTRNTAQGNYIGANANGNAALGNGPWVMKISNASNNTIGGTDADDGAVDGLVTVRDVVSGNVSDGAGSRYGANGCDCGEFLMMRTADWSRMSLAIWRSLVPMYLAQAYRCGIGTVLLVFDERGMRCPVLTPGCFEAIAAANADASRDACPAGSEADKITFAPALDGQTINLTTVGDGTFGPSALAVTTQIAIEGPGGGDGVAVARNGSASNMRLFCVDQGGDLTLRDLTLKDGVAQGGNGGTGFFGDGGAFGLGGGLFNRRTLHLDASMLTGNQAVGGFGGSNGGYCNGDSGSPNGGSGNAANDDGYGSGGFGGFGSGSFGGGRGVALGHQAQPLEELCPGSPAEVAVAGEVGRKALVTEPSRVRRAREALQEGQGDGRVDVAEEAGSARPRGLEFRAERGLDKLCPPLLAGHGVERVVIERPAGPLVERLLEAGFVVQAVRPYQLKAARRRFRPSGGLSDAFDAFVLARLTRADGHRFEPLLAEPLANRLLVDEASLPGAAALVLIDTPGHVDGANRMFFLRPVNPDVRPLQRTSRLAHPLRCGTAAGKISLRVLIGRRCCARLPVAALGDSHRRRALVSHGLLRGQALAALPRSGVSLHAPESGMTCLFGSNHSSYYEASANNWNVAPRARGSPCLRAAVWKQSKSFRRRRK